MTFRITPTTELQALNTLLSIIGAAPVSSIARNTNGDVTLAKQILDETNVEVQSAGWHFNTEYNIELVRNASNKIPVASNVTSIDASKANTYNFDIVLRNGFLFDLKNNTDVFSDSVAVDQVTIQEFEQIPEVFRRLIMIKAGRKFQGRTVGSSELAGFTQEDEKQAIIDAERIDSDTSDHNILNDNYSVFNILNRPTRRTY